MRVGIMGVFDKFYSGRGSCSLSRLFLLSTLVSTLASICAGHGLRDEVCIDGVAGLVQSGHADYFGRAGRRRQRAQQGFGGECARCRVAGWWVDFCGAKCVRAYRCVRSPSRAHVCAGAAFGAALPGDLQSGSGADKAAVAAAADSHEVDYACFKGSGGGALEPQQCSKAQASFVRRWQLWSRGE